MLGRWKEERAGPGQTPGPWGWGQLPTYFPSQQLICSLIQSPVEKTLTDVYCVHALLLGSGNMVTVMALGLVKQRHGQPTGLIITGETCGGKLSAWWAVETE